MVHSEAKVGTTVAIARIMQGARGTTNCGLLRPVTRCPLGGGNKMCTSLHLGGMPDTVYVLCVLAWLSINLLALI